MLDEVFPLDGDTWRVGDPSEVNGVHCEAVDMVHKQILDGCEDAQYVCEGCTGVGHFVECGVM